MAQYVLTPGRAAIVALVALCGAILRRILARSPLENLPGPSYRSSFLFGDLAVLLDRKNGDEAWQVLAETYGPVSRIRGVIGGRILHVFDSKALHSVLIKDVDIYPKTVARFDELEMLLGPGLLTTKGIQHRRQRKMLNPVFSTAHLRNMAGIFYDIARRVHRAIEERVGKNSTEIDMNGWMARATLEMLGQAGLGYSFDDFSGDSTDDYGENLKAFFPVLASVAGIGFIVPKLSAMFSERTVRRLFRLYPLARLHRILDISDVMARRSAEIIEEKKLALEKGDNELVHRVGEGKDIMSILLKANVAAEDSEKLTDEELVAQMSTFILAGMDTTSNALSRILFLLAQHPDAQEKLRAEIMEAQGGSDKGANMEYDDLVKLPYLDAICRETLRLYAPVSVLLRRAAKDTVLPLSDPIRAQDGKMLTEVVVPKGNLVLLNLRASNRNKALWGEDALEWRPERWMEPVPSELEEARVPGVYSNVMSFSGGTRSCIGFKFSQLEMTSVPLDDIADPTEIVLSVLLPSFSFELTEKPIIWNVAAVQYPTMGEDSAPRMLLNVKHL